MSKQKIENNIKHMDVWAATGDDAWGVATSLDGIMYGSMQTHGKDYGLTVRGSGRGGFSGNTFSANVTFEDVNVSTDIDIASWGVEVAYVEQSSEATLNEVVNSSLSTFEPKYRGLVKLVTIETSGYIYGLMIKPFATQKAKEISDMETLKLFPKH